MLQPTIAVLHLQLPTTQGTVCRRLALVHRQCCHKKAGCTPLPMPACCQALERWYASIEWWWSWRAHQAGAAAPGERAWRRVRCSLCRGRSAVTRSLLWWRDQTCWSMRLLEPQPLHICALSAVCSCMHVYRNIASTAFETPLIRMACIGPSAWCGTYSHYYDIQ